MADTFQLDLVAPERKLASLEATSVHLPGQMGDMTVGAGHAATMTTIRPGVVTITTATGTEEHVVIGGFADISPERVTILAERALPRDEMSQEILDAEVEKAQKLHDDAHEDVAHETAQFLGDLVAMGGHLGLDSKAPNL